MKDWRDNSRNFFTSLLIDTSNKVKITNDINDNEGDITSITAV